MKERLNLLRNYLNLSQEDFGLKIGVTKASISRLENGTNNFTERTILSICREFNVNEDWLRYGKGEMFKPESLDELETLADKYDLTDLEKALLDKWLKLPLESRKKALEFIKEVFLPEPEPELRVIPAAGRNTGKGTETMSQEQLDKALESPTDYTD